MPYILASVDPIHGYVLLETNWADTPTVQHVRIIRITTDDGVETVVRVHTYADDSGQYITLSGGAALVYDTEAPLDRAVTYRAEALESTATVTSGSVTFTASGNLWLKDPLYPAHNRLLIFTLNGDPACIPGEGIFFVGLAQQGRPGYGNAMPVDDAKYPIPVVRVRGSITSTLTLVTRTFADRDDLELLLSPGTVLLLQVPAAYGIGERYLLMPADVPEDRPLSDHKRPWRVFNLPHVTVLMPTGLSYGVYGSRWADVCDTYPTFADATAANLEWSGAMQGEAGPAGSGVGAGAGWRTWTDVTTDFASWTAVNTGGRTWQDLLEGS